MRYSLAIATTLTLWGLGTGSGLAQIQDFEGPQIDGAPVFIPPGEVIDPVEIVEPLDEQFEVGPQPGPDQIPTTPTSDDAFIPVVPATEPTPTFNPARPAVNPLPATALPGGETAYTLDGGDVLQINVFDVPDYTGQYIVAIDGTIHMPLLGSINVRGLTIAELNQTLEAAYQRYLVRPLINTSLLSLRPLQVAIAGAVENPGTYTSVDTTTSRRFLTAVEALELANGVTFSADIRNVQLRRQTSGVERVYRLNLWDLVQYGDIHQNVTLRDGDSIFVPTTNTYDPIDIQVLLAASFAPDVLPAVQVNVSGEVSRPGTYLVTVGNALSAPVPPTVTAALAAAGGITPNADIRNISLRRSDRQGQETILDIDLWALLIEGDINQDVLLQPYDAIIIPRDNDITPEEAIALAKTSFSPDQIIVSVIGEVVSAGRLTLEPGATLNQGILSAGGFNNVRAKKAFVDLIRLNPDGTVTNRKVDVDFAAGLNDENNPVLQNGDVVVVRRNALTGFNDVLQALLSPVTNTFSALNFFRIFGILQTDQ
ncbi:MAG: sugar ABC transporter substrate-binding protein [Spirulina sp. SIO3F2]|nr:sugar ABC transporter substrate-binding protein [Spirulina sp. SIO3F2]